MTATEPNPTAEHTDAVARAMRQDPKSGGRNMSDVAREVYAERLLTSTDPAVHAAMLAALVRAGVLTEDRERLVRACGCIANEEPAGGPVSAPEVGDRVRVIAGQWTGWEGVVTADLISGYGLVVQLASPAHPGRIYTSTLRRDEVEVIEP